MKKLSAFFFILGLILTEVHAAPICPNASPGDKSTKVVNLIREMPPIRDQDGIGWCYSFTSADLLTHYLYKTQPWRGRARCWRPQMEQPPRTPLPRCSCALRSGLRSANAAAARSSCR